MLHPVISPFASTHYVSADDFYSFYSNMFTLMIAGLVFFLLNSVNYKVLSMSSLDSGLFIWALPGSLQASKQHTLTTMNFKL